MQKVGLITKIVALVKTVLIIEKEKYKKLDTKVILYLVLLMYLIAGIFTYENINSIFAILAGGIYFYKCWDGDAITVKKAAAFSYCLWFIYNVNVLAYSSAIFNIISMISACIAIRNARKDIDQDKG